MTAPRSSPGCAKRTPATWRRDGNRSIDRRGASLLELIVVLFIIGVMASLLFPAIQSARVKVNTSVCQNNVRQVGMGVRRYIDTRKRFPAANHWTIDILKYIEEWPLAEALAHGVPEGMKPARPKILNCPEQAEPSSSVEGVRVCHYVLVVDRPLRAASADKVRWDLHDREELSQFDALDPWYVGPEISFATQQQWFAEKLGPHESGTFYDSRGQTRGGD
jgi:prepilin-type N-terminal cleavage/methylation domain-containing protein